MPSGIYPRTEAMKQRMYGNTYALGIPRSGEVKEKISKNNARYWLGKKGNCGNYKDGRMSDPKYVVWLRNKRNMQLKSSEGSHTFEEWQEVKSKFNNTCPCCAKSEPEIALSVDHIVPVSKGGTNYISNIQPLCRSCNSKKNNKTIVYQPLI